MKDLLTILTGDCRETLKGLPDGSVQCCVTSPPYWGLRDYGCDGQMGLEKSPEEYVAEMVAVFREVRRVLKDEGTLWMNLGDSYNAAGRSGHGNGIGEKQETNRASATKADHFRPSAGLLKPKDLIGIPWMVAFALRADGWYLRQDIIWHKPNPMPESVTDRCTKAHEYVFLLSKGPRYFYDIEAMKEPVNGGAHERRAYKTPDGWDTSKGEGGHGTIHKNGREKGEVKGRGSWNGSQFHTGKTGEHQLGRSQKERKLQDDGRTKNNASFDAAMAVMPEKRNKRSVWTVASAPFKEAHFATYPPDLIKPCILAGSRVGDVVLDPFGGSGTTGMVALELGRKAVLCELNPDYVAMMRGRCAVTPGLPLGD